MRSKRATQNRMESLRNRLLQREYERYAMKVGLAVYELLNDETNAGGRVFPELAPEGMLMPYIVYSIVSNQPSDAKDGTPIDEAQVEIYSVGASYSAATVSLMPCVLLLTAKARQSQKLESALLTCKASHTLTKLSRLVRTARRTLQSKTTHLESNANGLYS